MPTILFVILFYFSSYLGSTMSDQLMVYVLIIIFITTFILPVFCVTVLKFTQNVSSFGLEDRKERILPFFFISLFYAITTYLFMSKIKLNTVYLVVIASITVIIFLVTIITLFWKISTQSTALSATIGFLIAIAYKYPQDTLLYPLVILILLAGFIMSLKLYLNVNKPNEILAGSILGFFISTCSVYFFA